MSGYDWRCVMLRGEYKHTIDAKGRIILPQKFRESLGERFIITRGLENCLFVYGLSVWEKFERKAAKMPVTDDKARRFVRFFFGGAFEAELDAQGRTVIPQHLKEYAGLNREIVSFGVPSRVEIWSKENWDEYNSKENFVDEELAVYIRETGF